MSQVSLKKEGDVEGYDGGGAHGYEEGFEFEGAYVGYVPRSETSAS